MHTLAKVVEIENGWLLVTPYHQEDDGVIEGFTYNGGGPSDEQDGPVEAFYRLLWALLDAAGQRGTKHDQIRIRIYLEPGSDYDGGEAADEDKGQGDEQAQ